MPESFHIALRLVNLNTGFNGRILPIEKNRIGDQRAGAGKGHAVIIDPPGSGSSVKSRDTVMGASPWTVHINRPLRITCPFTESSAPVSAMK